MILAFRDADLTSRDTDDAKLVVSNWSASYKESYSAGIIDANDWATVMHAQIWKHLHRPDARTLVAFEKADPSFMYGWISGEPESARRVVYYVYVKESFRKAGIARQLLSRFGVDPSRPFEYACQTPIVFEELRPKMPRARWNPKLLRYPKSQERNQRWKR